MHAAGVTCSNCHDPHSAKLRAEGNGLCAQCHLPARFDAREHHHHEPGSAGAQCVNCHMPTKTYMVVDARRDHSIRVPRPDLSISLGTPNACSQCHAERPVQWAAETVASWYPGGRQTTPHYGTALHAGRTGAADAEQQLDRLILDQSQPAIARASALPLLGPYMTPASEPAIKAAIADATRSSGQRRRAPCRPLRRRRRAQGTRSSAQRSCSSRPHRSGAGTGRNRPAGADTAAADTPWSRPPRSSSPPRWSMPSGLRRISTWGCWTCVAGSCPKRRRNIGRRCASTRLSFPPWSILPISIGRAAWTSRVPSCCARRCRSIRAMPMSGTPLVCFWCANTIILGRWICFGKPANWHPTMPATPMSMPSR